MSKLSINNCNQACSDINSAIKFYSSAYEKINKTNDNPSTQEILSLIKTEIDKLEKINSKIENVSSTISVKMKAVDGSDNK